MTTMADLTFNQQLQKHRVKIARVIWIALILFLFVYKRTPVMPLDSTFGILGIVVTLLGVTVRSLSAGALRKNEVLATEGLYAIVRNPLYLGSLTMSAGFAIAAGDGTSASVGAGLKISDNETRRAGTIRTLPGSARPGWGCSSTSACGRG